ncbi:MAG: ATP-binding domain-containing protein, partial [Gammaproteobacteria bacterium]|nr:ATP-binding domain-containing protein [Gammaproteobacteria bacterium]
RIYGGQRFFERAEIRNALAYLRLVSHRHADAAFERVVNLPTRGIGNRTLDEIRILARRTGVSLWQAAVDLAASTQLPGRARNAIIAFIDLINRLDNETTGFELAQLTDKVIAGSGLKTWYEQEKGEKGQARLENLAELITAAQTFDPDAVYPGEGDESVEYSSVLDAFLAHAALEAGDGQADPEEDCVQLMTLHSAKGLEFPLVFLTGMEEGLFPHHMSAEEPGRMEEERRLCYVGVTRAMRLLYLTHAESRRINGNDNYNRPSRFIREIPEEYINEVREHHSTISAHSGERFKARYPGTKKSQSLLSESSQSAATRRVLRGAEDPSGTGFRIGQTVSHGKFGEGVVLNFEGEGKQARVQVNFRDAGSKWLVVSYANLQAV